MTAPVATYRLQLNAELGFTAAAAVAPYLKRLGITHLYASPILKARLTRRLRLRKSLPIPAFRGMNVTALTSKFATVGEPFACGRPVGPCRLTTPEVMLNGSAE